MKPTVLLAGTFDILHPGHLSLIRQAKRFGNVTIIVARDENVIKEKGRAPFYKERARTTHLKAIPGIHKVVLGRKKDKLAAILMIKPDIIALGYDQRVSVRALTTYANKHGLKPRIIRLKAFKPGQFKSGKLRP